MKAPSRRMALAASLLSLILMASACSNDDDGSADPGHTTTVTGKSGKVALLLPESRTTRYETQDRPLFEAKMKALCRSCEILYANADQDATKQQNQADTALANGAKVLVLDPVDAVSAASIVTKAKAQNVPVVSYDRLVKNSSPDFYVSFDNEQVGRLQGQALLDKLTNDGKAGLNNKIVMINGSPTDNNATLFKKGAHSVLNGKVTIGREYDTPDWSNNKAQEEMEQAITALGLRNIVGVYAANDRTAGGVIAALKGAGATQLPPVTGQDAEVAGIQRLLVGEQYMSVYKAIKPEAEAAAQAAYDLLQGKKPVSTTTVNNGHVDVPSTLLTPVAITKDNVKETVFEDGYWTPAQVCTGVYAAACAAAGIS